MFLHLYHDAVLDERQTIGLMRDLQNILDKKKANETVDKKDWKKYSGFIFQNSKTQEWCLNATKVQNACKYRNCEIFLPFFNFLKNITFWCQSTQENVYGTNKQCCSH